jgi:hypothetical protein
MRNRPSSSVMALNCSPEFDKASPVIVYGDRHSGHTFIRER